MNRAATSSSDSLRLKTATGLTCDSNAAGRFSLAVSLPRPVKRAALGSRCVSQSVWMRLSLGPQAGYSYWAGNLNSVKGSSLDWKGQRLRRIGSRLDWDLYVHLCLRGESSLLASIVDTFEFSLSSEQVEVCSLTIPSDYLFNKPTQRRRRRWRRQRRLTKETKANYVGLLLVAPTSLLHLLAF